MGVSFFCYLFFNVKTCPSDSLIFVVSSNTMLAVPYLISMQSLTRFMTWNVKGLGHVIKSKKKILSFLKKERASVAMLQETHLQ